MTPLFARGNKQTKIKLLSLRAQAYRDRQPRIALRIQGILLSLDKRTTGEIATALKINRTTVPLWIHNWNNYRETGLKEGYHSGRPALLSKTQVNQLYDIIESGPVAYGLRTGIWTSPMIKQIILDEFDIDYHVGHVRKLLHQIGFSVQRPTLSIVTGNQRDKRKWIRFRYPGLKKKPKRKVG